MKLNPNNNYTILDPDTSTTYTGASYEACFPRNRTRIENMKLRRHLKKNGVFGQSTPEGQWLPTRITDPEDITKARMIRERTLVLVALIVLAVLVLAFELVKL